MTAGVYVHKKTGKYAVQINRDGIRYFLGLHPTEQAAADARAAFAATLPQKNPQACPPPAGGLTQARVRELFRYDDETGNLIWQARTSRRIKVGEVAGHQNRDGRWSIRVDGKLYLAHRLVWLWLTGELPSDEIDHKDGNGANNRRENIRPAVREENAQNMALRSDNATGFTGVYWHRAGKKYAAEIRAWNKRYFLGLFQTKALAAKVYREAKSNLHTFNPVQRGLS